MLETFKPAADLFNDIENTKNTPQKANTPVRKVIPPRKFKINYLPHRRSQPRLVTHKSVDLRNVRHVSRNPPLQNPTPSTPLNAYLTHLRNPLLTLLYSP